MTLPKCTVTIVASGPGGLSVKRPCGKLAVKRFGRRRYCREHGNQERRRLHLHELNSGACIVVTHTPQCTKYSLEPGGGTVRPEVFRELVTLGLLLPVSPADTLFPNIQPQAWQLRPGVTA